MNKLGISALLLVSCWVNAQGIPGTEIVLFDINESAGGQWQLSQGTNITQHPGYDSQPRFSKSGDVIYYTRFVDGQTDVYQYRISDGSTQPFMVTPESEYSPNVGHQSGVLSVVQVDVQGDQYLVFLNPSADKDQQMVRHSDLKQVGYFGWTHGTDAWSFVLNDQNGGDLYHVGRDRKAHKLGDPVGRSFITSPDGKSMYYVDKSATPWRIKLAHNPKDAAQDVMALPLGVEDFTVDSLGRFWAGRDNTLFVSTDHKRWYIAAEFTNPALHQITRLTTHPDASKIAIVFAEKSDKE